MNKELMLKVADAVVAEPENYCQGSFGDVFEDERYFCETPCCLAGLVVILAGNNFDLDDGVAQAARALLEIKKSTFLFTATWPLEVLPEEMRNQTTPDRVYKTSLQSQCRRGCLGAAPDSLW